ncbi:MAG: phosphatidylserine decarboxylase [Planctomycetota bacterium]
MLSPQAKSEWVSLLAIGGMVTVAAGLFGWTWGWFVVPAATLAVVAFYRDPARRTPSNRRVMVSPSDGRVSSIHEVEHFEPLGGPALCVRVFISILNVHVVRSPCHAAVGEPTVREGRRRSALHPRAPEDNAAVLVPLDHPVKGKPVAAVRLVAGLFARSISVCAAPPAVIQRGERLGIIKLGSTAELYIPMRVNPEPAVEVGQKVRAGVTVLVEVASESESEADDASVDGDGAEGMASAAGAAAAVLPAPPIEVDALGVETPSAPVGEVVAPVSAEPDDAAEDEPVQEPEAEEDAPRGGDGEAEVDHAFVDAAESADDAGADDAWAGVSEADGESSDEEEVEEEDLEDEEFEEEEVVEEAEDVAADGLDEESDADEDVDDEDEWEVVEEEGYEDGEEAVEEEEEGEEEEEDDDKEQDQELDEHEDDEAEEDWGGEEEEAADEGVEEDGLEEAAVEEFEEEEEEAEEGEEVEDNVAEEEPEDADPFAEDSTDESPVGLPTGLFGVAVDELSDDEPIEEDPVDEDETAADAGAGSGADQSEASADMSEGDEPHTPLAPPPKAQPKFEPKRKR